MKCGWLQKKDTLRCGWNIEALRVISNDAEDYTTNRKTNLEAKFERSDGLERSIESCSDQLLNRRRAIEQNRKLDYGDLTGGVAMLGALHISNSCSSS